VLNTKHTVRVPNIRGKTESNIDHNLNTHLSVSDKVLR